MREIKTLDELKSVELAIMKKIHQFCLDNNIKYCLAFGTLIGAIRHKGFIPWDDDIDILMPREDYERFMNLFEDYGKEHDLCIASSVTKPYYCRPFAKVCNIKTIQYEPKYKDEEPRGVFVDVWPLDGYPTNKWKRMIHKNILVGFFVALMGSVTKIEYVPENQKMKRNLIRIFSMFDSRKILKYFERAVKKYPYDCSEWVTCAGAKPDIYRREWFDSRILVDFEDTKFWAPKMYHEYLTARYGNYMQLPPEEHQQPHHVIETYWKEDKETGNHC